MSFHTVLTPYLGQTQTSLSGGSITSSSSICRWNCSTISNTGLNLTQFNNIGTFRPDVAQHIPRPSTRHAGLEICSIDPHINWCCLPHKSNTDQALYHLTWIEVMSFLHLLGVWQNIDTCWSLIATALHTIWHWSKITELPEKVWRLTFHSSTSLIIIGVKSFSLYIPTLFCLSSSLLMKDLLFEVETSWVNFFASFNADNQRKICIYNISK